MGKNRRDVKDFYFDYYFFLRLADISRILFPRVEWAVIFTFATLFLAIASTLHLKSEIKFKIKVVYIKANE